MQKVPELEDPRLAGSSSGRNELDPPAPSSLCPHPILGEMLGGGHTHEAPRGRGSSRIQALPVNRQLRQLLEA